MEAHECMMYANDHRQAISTYKEFKDPMKMVGMSVIKYGSDKNYPKK